MGQTTQQAMHQVLALIHVHTMANDGSAEPGKIVRLAQLAGSGGGGAQRPRPPLARGRLLGRRADAGRPGNKPPPQPLAGPVPGCGPAPALEEDALAGSRAFITLDFSRIEDCPGLELWNCLSAFKSGLRGLFTVLARLFIPKTFLPGPDPLLARPRGEAVWPGQELAWRLGQRMEVGLPAWGRARLLRDGTEVATGLGRRFVWTLDRPGV